MLKRWIKNVYRVIFPNCLIIRLSGKNFIDRKKILKKIKDLNKLGVTKEKRSQKLIVSLTSFPGRIDEVCYTIYSLLTQSLKPDILILWLKEEEFSNDFQQKELCLLEQWGLTIKFYHKNFRSYNKLIPVFSEYPNDVIITADDDIYYEKDWLQKLYSSSLYFPDSIVCHRAHEVVFDKKKKILPYNKWNKNILNSENDSSILFATGVGGILYPPNSLHSDVIKAKLFMKLAPDADDVWFWIMALKRGTKIILSKDNIRDLTYVNVETELGLNKQLTLAKKNIWSNVNDSQIKNVIEYYNYKFDKL